MTAANVAFADAPPAPPAPLGLRSLARHVSGSELRSLLRIQPWRIAIEAGADWALVLGSLWLWARSGHPAVWLLAFFVIGTRQHSLVNWIHESAHYNVSRNKRRNDWISDVLFAAPVLLDTASFRLGHAPHHSHLGDAARDTEKRLWINVRGVNLARLLLEHFSGARAVRAVLRYAPRDPNGGRPSLVRYGGLVAATQGALFAYCAWLGAPFAYLTLWLYPLFSLGLLLVSLLAIVQHQTEAYARAGETRLETSFVPPLTRTSPRMSLAERVLFAPIGAAWHVEHHLLPGVPHTQLRRMNALLRERGFYRGHPEGDAPGYLALLTRLVRPGSV